MTDLSVPPLTLVPLDGQSLGQPTPNSSRADGPFAWPTPALPCFPAPRCAVGPEACEIEAQNGRKSAGRLMHFSPTQGLAHVQVRGARTTLALRFAQFRRLELLATLQPIERDPEDTTPMALMERRAQPTGGVICAISTTSTTKMPNHSVSMPAFSMVGRITPIVSTTIEMPSRKQPSST